MLVIPIDKSSGNSNLKKIHTRKNPYIRNPVPKKIRKPAEFKRAGDYLFATLAQGNGIAVAFKTKNKCNQRYAKIWVHLLKQKHLIVETPGYYFNQNDWQYKKLTPSPAFTHALTSYLAENEAPEPTGDTLIDNLNLFYKEYKWQGCAQPIVKRNKEHGRLYSQGPNHYQKLTPDERIKIKCNNKEMAELDISGSHMTALIGMNTLIPVDGDPYEIPGFSRGDVKGAFKILLGSEKEPTSWFQDNNYRTGKTKYEGNCKKVTKALIKRYPFLKQIDKGTHQQLMKRESDVIVRVIRTLMKHEIVALSMHDGLLVEATATETAKQLLESEYEREFSITPRIKVKTPDGAEVSDEHNQEQVNLEEIKEWVLQQVGGGATKSKRTSLRRVFSGQAQGHSSAIHHNYEKVAPVAHGGKRAGAGRKKQEPWTALGMSKDKYYRLKRKGVDPATVPTQAKTSVETEPNPSTIIEPQPEEIKVMSTETKTRDEIIKERVARLKLGLPILSEPEVKVEVLPPEPPALSEFAKRFWAKYPKKQDSHNQDDNE